jgi:ubiquinone/menaquinone biosynthesis C-methylase UbiE
MSVEETIQSYYDRENEDDRLKSSEGVIELYRTQVIIGRYLTSRTLKVLDVGGGTGPYSFWLSDAGHEVHLLDPVGKHIRLASERNEKERNKLASLRIGEAGNLPFPDSESDLLLLMGPLYHLYEPKERLTALAEANRVLRSNGLLVSTHISRFASLLDGYRSDFICDPEFQSIVFDDLATGKHRGSADGTTKYFTKAYLQRPDEIAIEATAAGFSVIELLPLESFAWMIPNVSKYWNDTIQRDILLKAIALVEKETSIIGVSPHLMLICRKE